MGKLKNILKLLGLAPPLVFPPVRGEVDVLVLNVVDGDTVRIAFLVPEKIRLSGIDAPEQNTPAGQEAKAMLAYMLFGGTVVTVTLDGREKCGRLLGRFRTEEYHDVNRAMIDSGYAKAWGEQGPRPKTVEPESDQPFYSEEQRRYSRRLWAVACIGLGAFLIIEHIVVWGSLDWADVLGHEWVGILLVIFGMFLVSNWSPKKFSKELVVAWNWIARTWKKLFWKKP